MTPRAASLALLAALAAPACTDNNKAAPDASVGMDAGSTDAATGGDTPAVTDAPAVTDGEGADVAPGPSADCDPLDETGCALPWPSNLYLHPDSTRRTGYTLSFGATSLPSNNAGRSMGPEPYHRMDGYSVGTPIMAVFPGVDIHTFATEDHIERSVAPDAAVLLFEVAGTELHRVPYWVELDSHETDPSRQILYVRPAVILKESTRYVVAFRNLQTTAGAVIAPSAAFAALRDGHGASDPRLAPRQPRFNEVLGLLEGAGVPRGTLTLAWDFITASNDAMHGRMLQMRDDVLTRVGPMGPELVVDTTTEFVATADGSGRAVDPDIALELVGHIEVPNYMRMTRDGTFVGWEFNLDASGRVVPTAVRVAQFWVRVPRSALTGTPHGLVMYGHGLLGSGSEVESGYIGQIANHNNLIFFAADLTGMSSPDALAVVGALRNFDHFPWIADNLHQGMVEWLVLARAMRERLGALAPIASRHIVVNHDELFYSGNSQGGIFGGTYVALSTDITRGHLGVPGSNYSTLLQRSHDFDGYFAIVRANYPSSTDQAIALAAVQLLWDGTDPVTYYRHMSLEPFAGTPSHAVVMTPAKGDLQVAVITDEVLGRSDIGIPLMANYDNQRTPWGITQAAYPRNGSGVVLYDFGNPWPPLGNIPPQTLPDPHELPRRNAGEQHQMVNFFRTGQIIDVCGGHGCHPN